MKDSALAKSIMRAISWRPGKRSLPTSGSPKKKHRPKRSKEQQNLIAAYRKRISLLRRTKGHYPEKAWSPSSWTCPICAAKPGQVCTSIPTITMKDGEVKTQTWSEDKRYHEERPGLPGSKRKKMRLVKLGRI